MQDDEHIYEQVAAELKGGNRKEGLWLKAQTQAEGNADKTQALYVKWRVEQLAEEEEQRRLEEEQRLEEQRLEEQRLEEQRQSFAKSAEDCMESLKKYGYSVEWATQDTADGKRKAWRVQKPDGESVWFNNIAGLASFVKVREKWHGKEKWKDEEARWTRQAGEEQSQKEAETCIELLRKNGYRVKWEAVLTRNCPAGVMQVLTPGGEIERFYSIDSLASFVEKEMKNH